MWFSRISEWLGERKGFLGAVCAWVLTHGFYVAAFPPFRAPEGAFVFLVPFLLWLRWKPSYRRVAWWSLSGGWACWLALIFWLRHVTYAGMVLLALVMAVFYAAWALGAAWLSRRLISAEHRWDGIAFAVAAASWWVVVEHTRGWFLTGFPWLPLAASQWDRPVMLQSASVFGQWGISFALVLLNAGLAGYAVRLVEYAKTRRRSLCPEFYFGLGVMVSMTFLMTRLASGQQREGLMKAAVVQPNIPQDQKWDARFTTQVLNTVQRQSLFLAPTKADAMFWPEAVLPYPLLGDETLRRWANQLADELGMPIFAGALAVEGEGEDEVWRNSVFLVRPQYGMFPKYYSKRHLVPFGEYIPLRPLWPWIETIVPLEGDFEPGEEVSLLPLNLPERTVQVGALICYEDVFPGLARKSVKEGAALLFVATNSAWYGQSGAGAQHMAHSALRAVENRRVVIRVGNDGWTGWINEYGRVEDSFEMWERGGMVFDMDRDRRWVGRLTFYTRWGDWFVGLCAAMLAGCGYWGWLRKREPAATDG